MANTYSQIYYHIVFSTKNRVDWITPAIENRVWAYIGGIARRHKMTAIQIGGIDNHMHGLLASPPVYSPSQIAKYLKGDSSRWIHNEFQELSNFAWQDGYGAFTVSKSEIDRVRNYILNQRKHHEKQTFEEEYIALLNCMRSNTTSGFCLDDSSVADATPSLIPHVTWVETHAYNQASLRDEDVGVIKD